MKVKGVTGGKMRGNPIEFSPEEKPELALKDAVHAAAPQGEKWWVEGKPVVTAFHYTSNGSQEKGRPGYANNSYTASGEVVIRRLILKTDDFMAAVKRGFVIEFKDIIDDNNMPDLEVTKFELG